MADESLSSPNSGFTAAFFLRRQESLPVAAALHFSRDLNVQARREVEGRDGNHHALDLETVLCARWIETMEAA